MSQDPERRRRDGGFRTYAVGRPLMLVVWGVALWGTLVAARLVWVAGTQGLSTASRSLLLPAVSGPILLALVMWIALGLALGRSYRDDEP